MMKTVGLRREQERTRSSMMLTRYTIYYQKLLCYRWTQCCSQQTWLNAILNTRLVSIQRGSGPPRDLNFRIGSPMALMEESLLRYIISRALLWYPGPPLTKVTHGCIVDCTPTVSQSARSGKYNYIGLHLILIAKYGT
jgi:hypothetical protein